MKDVRGPLMCSEYALRDTIPEGYGPLHHTPQRWLVEFMHRAIAPDVVAD